MNLPTISLSFNAVQNNTSLKPLPFLSTTIPCFNAVQNNTSLKQSICRKGEVKGFNAVQNNTSLKLINDIAVFCNKF